MTSIRVYNGMEIHLGSTARLEIKECSDGEWNIQVVQPRLVRIGVETQHGIHYRYVDKLIKTAEEHPQ